MDLAGWVDYKRPPNFPIMIVSVIFALLPASATPPRPEPTVSQTQAVKQKEKEEAAKNLLDVFFWAALILLIALVGFRYTSG